MYRSNGDYFTCNYYLKFNYGFNKSLDDVDLPVDTQRIKFTWWFDNNIDALISCQDLSMLYFDVCFNKDISCFYYLPNLTHVLINRDQNHNAFTHMLHTYYLVDFIILCYHTQKLDAYKRCNINKHNLRIKQTAFYDLY